MQKNPAFPPDLRIPVIDEKYSVSKRVRTKDFIVEKRWVTKTVSIPVSVKYEEIFVNGKRFGSGLEGVLSSIKGSIKRETEAEKEKKRRVSDVCKVYWFSEIIVLFGPENAILVYSYVVPFHGFIYSQIFIFYALERR
jgi:hypothetical protein